jgi:hypothetical protein
MAGAGRRQPKGKNGVIKILLAVIVASLPTAAMAAERLPRQTKQATQTRKPPRPNPCAQYGAGFKQVEGTSTCVKIGGVIEIDAAIGAR